MTLQRRAFLQRASLLAALGLSEAGFGLLSQRYQQALAQPMRRKLALLIGINQYPESVCDYTLRNPASKGSALNGCLTDVELQYELLLSRFAFASADIRVLTNQAATREAIETAFLEHLVEQAAPGDLVLFHFSGLGSQVQIDGATWQNSLVPIDGLLPTAERPVVQDFMQETLALLLHRLPTSQVITIIDAGYSRLGRSTEGNLRIRSRPNAPVGAIAAAELAFQASLRRPGSSFSKQSQPLPGLLLQAGTDRQLVAEAQWSGFSAGLFTYALTQQLWGDAPLLVSFTQAAALVQRSTGAKQQPVASGELPALGLAIPAAAGVIQHIEPDGRLDIWLAGLPAAVLENQTSSLFAAELTTEPEPVLIQIRSRDGLAAKARSLSPVVLRPGQPLREVLRILPRDIRLTVALDPALERIERVDATSAFAAIPRITAVALGEQATDLLFGKPKFPLLAGQSSQPASQPDSAPGLTVQKTVQDTPQAPPLSKGGYGLFYADYSTIPSTLNPTAEAVKTAVARLKPQLKTRLATKLLQITQNSSASLKVKAKLNLVSPETKSVLEQGTRLAMPSTLKEPRSAPILPAGGQVQYALENSGDRPVYFLLIGLNANGNPVLLYPANPIIAAGAATAVPAVNGAKTGGGWLLQTATGLAETHVIFSTAPFTQTSQLLAELPQFELDQVLALPNPLSVVEAVLQDLHQASAEVAAKLPVEIPADSYALDVNAWASFSFVYQVVLKQVVLESPVG